MFLMKKEAKKWQEGLLLGNGIIGMIVSGSFQHSKIIGNHADAFLRTNKMDEIPYMADVLASLRKEIALEGYQNPVKRFENLALKRGYQGLTMSDYYHPIFELNIIFKNELVKDNYRRYHNYKNKTAYQTNDKLRVEYKIQEMTTYISYNSQENASCELYFEEFDVEGIHSSLKKEGSSFVLEYFDKSKYVSNITLKTDGQVEKSNNKITVGNFNKLDINISIEAPESTYSYKNIASKTNLLLQEQPSINQSINLVDDMVRKQSMSSELIQAFYDASKYYIESYSGHRIPNLQGLWGGDFSPAWSGDYTFDTNVQLAISSFASLGLKTSYLGFFEHLSTFFDDFEENAKKYFACSGYLVPAHASRRALHVHWNHEWPLLFWTSGAGWLAHFYQEYYEYTQDQDFLKNQALPFFESALKFYIDYIDEDFIISPSYSAENGLGDTPTMDIMVIEELIDNLKNAYEILEISDRINYKYLEENLVPYRVKDGVLCEWSDERSKENYSHRHFSHLYAVFQSRRLDKNSKYWEASKNAFKKKLDAWLYNQDSADTSSAHAKMQIAMLATSFEMDDVYDDALKSFFLNKSFFDNLASSHYDNEEVFNMDANGSFPKVIHDALVYHENNGSITLMKVKSKYLNEGSIHNLYLKNNLKIKDLTWCNEEIIMNLESKEARNIIINYNKESRKINLLKGLNNINF